MITATSAVKESVRVPHCATEVGLAPPGATQVSLEPPVCDSKESGKWTLDVSMQKYRPQEKWYIQNIPNGIAYVQNSVCLCSNFRAFTKILFVSQNFLHSADFQAFIFRFLCVRN